MDVIKSSSKIKQSLLDRWKEQDVSLMFVCQDARERGMKGICIEKISRWKKDPESKGALNQIQVIFLCERWGIELQLTVGSPNKKDVTYKVGRFNEKKALLRLSKLFPAL